MDFFEIFWPAVCAVPACSSKNSSFNGTTIEFNGGLNMLFKVDIVRASNRLESRINPPIKD